MMAPFFATIVLTLSLHTNFDAFALLLMGGKRKKQVN
jgi:hypothetical protein